MRLDQQKERKSKERRDLKLFNKDFFKKLNSGRKKPLYMEI